MAGSQLRRDQIRALADQWEQIAGYAAVIPDWMIDEMGAGGTQSLYDVGQYMSRHIGLHSPQDPTGALADGAHTWDEAWAMAMPWARYGLDHVQYQSMFNNANATFEQLTGQAIDLGTFDHFMVQSGGNLTSAGLRQSMLSDAGIMQTFGWMKFGLDFQQFQQQKQQMAAGMGVADPNAIDNQQALLQIQYSHRNQGGDREVAQQLTFTQQEKKAAGAGVSQSEVR